MADMRNVAACLLPCCLDQQGTSYNFALYVFLSFVGFWYVTSDHFIYGYHLYVSIMTFLLLYPTGSVLVFQHNIFHEGSVLVKGRKYAMRTDVMFTPVELPDNT